MKDFDRIVKPFRYPLVSVYAPVVPCTFDNSLSLLEMCGKIIHYSNELNNAINQNHTDIVSLGNHVEVIGGDVDALTERVEDLEERAEVFARDIEQMQVSIAEFDADLFDAESRIGDIELDINQMQTAISGMETRLGLTEREISQHSGNIAELLAADRGFDDRITALEEGQLSINSDIDDIQDDVDRIDSKVIENRGRIESLETEYDDLENRSDSLETRLTSLWDISSEEFDKLNAAMPLYLLFVRDERESITTEDDYTEAYNKFNNPRNNLIIARINYGGKLIDLLCTQYIETRQSLRFYGFDGWANAILCLDWKESGAIELRSVALPV